MKRWSGPLLLAVVAIVAAGCGAGDEGTQGAATTAATVSASVPSTAAPAAAPACTVPQATDESAVATIAPSDRTDSGGADSGQPSTTESRPESSAASAAGSTQAPERSAPDPVLAERQRVLDGLGYWLGEPDGRFGPNTAHAVTAFQKAEGLARTGLLDDATIERLATAATPTPRSSDGHVVEIDIDRQILLIAVSGTVERIFDVATGATATPTPPGEFSVFREIDGFRHAPLGTLYRPKYFNGGIALHGYTSVPPEPASHGCVRLTYAAMDAVWDLELAPLGTAVWVY